MTTNPVENVPPLPRMDAEIRSALWQLMSASARFGAGADAKNARAADQKSAEVLQLISDSQRAGESP